MSTTTNAERISIEISNGAIQPTFIDYYNRGCGSFMGDFKRSQHKIDCFMLYALPEAVQYMSEETIEWYIDRLREEIGLDVEYLGLEQNSKISDGKSAAIVFRHNVHDTHVHKLAAYTFVRFSWSNPYRKAVRGAHRFLKKYPEYNFGEVLTTYLSLNASSGDYYSRYGLYVNEKGGIYSSEEIKDKLFNYDKPIPYLSINNLFSKYHFCEKTGLDFRTVRIMLTSETNANHEKVKTLLDERIQKRL